MESMKRGCSIAELHLIFQLLEIEHPECSYLTRSHPPQWQLIACLFEQADYGIFGFTNLCVKPSLYPCRIRMAIFLLSGQLCLSHMSSEQMLFKLRYLNICNFIDKYIYLLLASILFFYYFKTIRCCIHVRNCSQCLLTLRRSLEYSKSKSKFLLLLLWRVNQFKIWVFHSNP